MLWVGTPALTIKGSTMASRSSASMLIASGLSELVCETAEQYEKLIEDLVTDTNRLESIRIHLIKTRNTNPLFDTSRYFGFLSFTIFNAANLLSILDG